MLLFLFVTHLNFEFTPLASTFASTNKHLSAPLSRFAVVEARENETIIENEIKHVKSALIRAKEVVANSAEHNEENTEGKTLQEKTKLKQR